MTCNIQLLSILISFIFGIIFYFITYMNFKLIKNMKVLFQHIITFVYVIDMTIIYILIIYKFNKGYFHLYFITMVLLGFCLAYLLNNKILSKLIVNRHFKSIEK